jgi:hypothetical protein
MPAIPQQLEDLEQLDKAALLENWKQVFHHPPPRQLRRDLILAILSYRLQEREHGGLSHAARMKLKQIANNVEAEKRSPGKGSGKLNAGTRLLRPGKAKCMRSMCPAVSSSTAARSTAACLR